MIPSAIQNFDIKTIAVKLLAGKAAAPFYYIIVLLYFTLSTPVLKKIINSRFRIAPFILSVMLFFCLYIIQLTTIDIWSYVHYTPVWLPFYYAGMYCREYNPRIKISRRSLAINVGIVLVLQIAENLLLYRLTPFYGMAYGTIRIGGFLYSGVLCIIAYKFISENDELKASKVNGWLLYIGNNSYGIFYVHCIIIIMIEKMIRIEMVGSIIIYRLIEVVCTMTVSLLVIYIIKKIFGEKNSRLLFGI